MKVMRCSLPLCLLVASAGGLYGQELQLPRDLDAAGRRGLRLDLIAVSERVGIDPTGTAQWVWGATVDLLELFSPQVRFRPSFEVSFDRRRLGLHWAGEIVYRFQGDSAPAAPYVGLGVGRYEQQQCDRCPEVWPTVVMGFEVRFRPGFNWLLEYHGLDRLGRHRFLAGVATRPTPRGRR